jgi:hypothetical protein
MNWTGGRLQRHSHSLTTKSANTRSLKTIQKQHFAKKRLALKGGECGSGRDSRVSPIQLLAAPSRFRDGGTHDALWPETQADMTEQRGSVARPVQDHNYHITANATGAEDGGHSEYQDKQQVRQRGLKRDLDSSRYDLLGRSDWARLSLARPLKTKFSIAAVDERENIAKRRRLTKDDQWRRLTENGQAGHYRVPIMREQRQSSLMPGSDAISIRIGEPGGRVRGTLPSATPLSQCRTLQMVSQESDESMLFNGDQSSHHLTPLAAGGRGYVTKPYESLRVRASPDSETTFAEEELPQSQRDTEEQLILSSSTQPHVRLPTLDRFGSFTTVDGRTIYNPPFVYQQISTPVAPRKERLAPVKPPLATGPPSTGPSRQLQRSVPLWISGHRKTGTEGYLCWAQDPDSGGDIATPPRPSPVCEAEFSRPNGGRSESRTPFAAPFARTDIGGWERQGGAVTSPGYVADLGSAASGHLPAMNGTIHRRPHRVAETGGPTFFGQTVATKPRSPEDEDAMWKRLILG